MHLNNLPAFAYVEDFDAKLINSLSKNVSLIYRNYKNINIEHILKIKNFCRRNKKKFYIANNFKLAIKLNIDGVYIPSFNKNLNVRYLRYKKNFELLGSAHSLKEIKIKEKQNISKIFLSPLFKTNKSKYFLGIYKFINLKNTTKQNVVCLGGLNKDNLNKLKLINPHGFASISLFK